MDRQELIIEKLRAGYRPAAVAQEFVVTRQYVYQLANKHGIDISKNVLPIGWKRGGPRIPEARVITGGVPARISHSVAGSICELLVAADLMARGWQVFMPVISSRGHDLIASKNKKLVTIEVRSAKKSSTGIVQYAQKPDCESDLYGVVVTGEPVFYIPDIESFE